MCAYERNENFDMKIINLLFFIVLFALWFSIGYINYKKRIETIKQYQELIKELDKDEKSQDDMYLAARAFNYRENLKNEYEPLEEIRIQLEEDEKKTKRQLITSFLLLGPLYNIR